MLQKQSFPINFAQGLDTKTDPKQVQIGKFLSLENVIFQKGGLLQKRNGFQQLPALPNTSSTYLTTFNDNLTAFGSNISALDQSTQEWVSKGTYQPLELSTLPLLRNNVNQTQCDSAIAPNGLICTAYTERANGVNSYKYVIANSITGQNRVAPTLLPPGTGTISGSPRVFVLGVYFVIVFTNNISGVYHLQYIAISINNPNLVTASSDIAANYTPSNALSWDGVVTNNNLYIAYNTSSGGQSIQVKYLTNNLSLSAAVTYSGYTATVLSMTVDISMPSRPVVYVSFYNSGSSTGYTFAINTSMGAVFAPVEIISSGTILNIVSAAQNGVCTVYYEVSNNYSYDSSIPSHYVSSVTVSASGSVGTPGIVIRSVGLASKAFIINGQEYFLSAFQSPYQPTYFLINGASTQASPIVVAKLAYENGGGYLALGLPSVSVSGNVAQIPYLFKDLVEALSTVGNTQQSTTGGIYSQTGINLAAFTIGTENITSTEIGNNLNFGGGFGWMYDGYLPVEQDFFLWPDSIEVTWSDTGGNMVANPPGWVVNQPSYFYQVIYEWTDNQGNVFRSAPSIPVPVTFSSPDASTTGSVTVNVPTLRLTYKTANPIKIDIYRWSVANQVYYQVTSITAPVLNSTTTDSISFVDTLSDASIIGNQIIYTTGGVVEDINPPAYNITTLFDTRQWVVTAENPNLLWYSKQIIQGAPVEFSDLLTYYIAPNAGTTSTTGPITAIFPMDDKLIVFKKNAIFYINGTGPDNTGANSNYSQPIFVTSTIGCISQNSIVFTPAGIIFQSSDGLWQLGRDLSTTYLGAPVEQFNASSVESAVNVPATTQVRFTLNTGQHLMYDFYYENWGTFTGIPAISSCVYQGLHTYLNSYGQVFQENPGVYLDGSNPVLMSFLTGHIQLQGVSGYQRIYEVQMLGEYISPHLLNVQFGYDYYPLSEQVLITPINYTGVYGSDSIYGMTSPYGGPGTLEQWRIQTGQQKCHAFQIGLTEVYDPSYGNTAGAGFTLSAMTCTLGLIRGYRNLPAAQTAGTSN